MKTIIAILFVIFLSFEAMAQPGTLDTTFGTGGKVITTVSSYTDIGYALAIQPDGKIVMIGNTTQSLYGSWYSIVRYNPDGTIDSTFNGTGIVSTGVMGQSNERCAYSIALQEDGKILVTGGMSSAYQFILDRYNMDGTPDITFGNSGRVQGYGYNYDLAIRPDGKIITCGGTHDVQTSQILLCRFNTNGTLDSSFGTGGVTLTNTGTYTYANSLKLQPDGKILISGIKNGTQYNERDFFIARYEEDGILDTTFGTEGITVQYGDTTNNLGERMIFLNEKIIIGLSYFQNPHFSLKRFDCSGFIDSTFGTSGSIFNNDIFWGGSDIFWGGLKMAVQGNNILVAGGTSEDNGFIIARFNEDGSLDSTFGTGGTTTTDFGYGYGGTYANACAIQADNKIVAVGCAGPSNHQNFALARYLDSLNMGEVIFSPESKMMLAYPNPLKTHANLKYSLQNDESISIVLYDANGRLVQSFVQEQKINKGQHTEHLNFDESLPAGSYILSLSNGKYKSSVQIIKQ
ncbi:MAG: T9SS type A sorting domain-containing protein [Bacteroidia bacterium]|nr:T9SS type A sorting domain-containing protein [Bacteroidia bacterium]